MATNKSDWPVLRSYRGEQLRHVAMPVGGIGTGTISLGGRGDLRDWELMNRPSKGFTPLGRIGGKGLPKNGPFFAVHAKPAGGPAVTRCLEGPLPTSEWIGSHGCSPINSGLPRFAAATFHAAYPLGQVELRDPKVPLRVTLQAYNPMIPGDAESSGLPVMVMRYRLHNPTNRRVAASVCGSIPNFIGVEPTDTVNQKDWHLDPDEAFGPRNRFRKTQTLQGIHLDATSLDDRSAMFGSLALSTTAKRGVTHRTQWLQKGWSGALLDFWDDLTDDGDIDPRPEHGMARPWASLCARVNVPPKATREVTFLVTWHFPNRFAWSNDAGPDRDRANVGNHYCTRFDDAWDAANKIAPRLDTLERTTVDFTRAFCDADISDIFKEAALFNASTLRTQTCFRTRDGRFFGWEGCGDDQGCCPGSCTHVWNYEYATSSLFGELSRSMREVEFGHTVTDSGRMAFRVSLPIQSPNGDKVAADGQMGTICRLYRDWRMSGDTDMLRSFWPDVKRSLQYAWIDGGWDGDRDGVMEGVQHNTMDVEYYGPNPEVGVWYLAALRVAAEMARHLGDDAFADVCDHLYASGSKWLDANLFNGEFYEHLIRVPDKIADGLTVGYGDTALDDPDWQVGPGCLADQLVGQLMSHACGLGHLLKPANIRKTLRSIVKHNTRRGFGDHFTNMRTYALGDDAGLLVCSYPNGDRPRNPFPYFNEVWTGMEYTVAAHLLYEGMLRQAEAVVRNTRDRHDGARRNPFNEPECGHHYARAMASWALIVAATGFDYDGTRHTLSFRASDKKATWFWSNGDAWGTVSQTPGKTSTRVSLRVMGGRLTVRSIALDGFGKTALPRGKKLSSGSKALSVAIRAE